MNVQAGTAPPGCLARSVQASTRSWVLLVLAQDPGVKKEALSSSAILFQDLERELLKKDKFV